jgi:hypothetical protein
VSVSNFPAAVTSVAVSNLPNIQSVSGNVSVSNFPATQSINATALPLPADAATQTTSAAILAKIIAAPATEAKQDTQLAQFTSNFGAIDSVAAATDTGTENLLALIKRLLGVKLPTALVRDRLKTDSLVRNMLRKLRDDFPGSALNPAIWTVVQTGAGQTIAVTNSELRITTGTTANSETIIRSVEKFTMPFRTWFIASLSQRIINQEFYLEIVDATGGHYASWMFDFTNANGAKFLSGNSGNTLGTTNTGNVGSSTNLYQIFEIECSPDEINFFTRASDSNASRFNTAGTKSRQIPDPNLEYFVQIRVKNLATAPATSTALNIDSISIQDIEELAVEVTGGRGGVNANQAIPAAIASSIALPVQNVTGRLDVNDFQLTTIETAIALAANAVYGGVARDSSTIKNTIRGWIFTDQPGTLIFEQSTSNTTFRQTDSVAVVGNATQVTRYEFKLVTRYYKIRYVNGATAQTTLDIISTAFNIGA